jgi:hypothetical protein
MISVVRGGFSFGAFRLFFSGAELVDESATVETSNIEDDSVLHLVRCVSGQRRVNVRYVRWAQDLSIEVDENEPVRRIMDKILRSGGPNVSDQHLSLGGTTLLESDTLSQDRLTDLDVIVLRSTLRIRIVLDVGDLSAYYVMEEDKIEKLLDTTIPADRQLKLLFFGKPLDTNYTFIHYSITDGCRLVATYSRRDVLLYLYNPLPYEKDSIRIMVDDMIPVGQLKERISVRYGIPTLNQVLVHAGEVLRDNERRLASYSIQRFDHIIISRNRDRPRYFREPRQGISTFQIAH